MSLPVCGLLAHLLGWDRANCIHMLGIPSSGALLVMGLGRRNLRCVAGLDPLASTYICTYVRVSASFRRVLTLCHTELNSTLNHYWESRGFITWIGEGFRLILLFPTPHSFSCDWMHLVLRHVTVITLCKQEWDDAREIVYGPCTLHVLCYVTINCKCACAVSILLTYLCTVYSTSHLCQSNTCLGGWSVGAYVCGCRYPSWCTHTPWRGPLSQFWL